LKFSIKGWNEKRKNDATFYGMPEP
jgi:hypothetical protein